MGIQRDKALLEAGVKEETAVCFMDSLKAEIKERLQEARKELVAQAHLAQAKAEIITWNLGAIIAIVGVMLAMSRLLG